MDRYISCLVDRGFKGQVTRLDDHLEGRVCNVVFLPKPMIRVRLARTRDSDLKNCCTVRHPYMRIHSARRFLWKLMEEPDLSVRMRHHEKRECLTYFFCSLLYLSLHIHLLYLRKHKTSFRLTASIVCLI